MEEVWPTNPQLEPTGATDKLRRCLGKNIIGVEFLHPINRLIINTIELSIPLGALGALGGGYAGEMFDMCRGDVILHGGRFANYLENLKRYLKPEHRLYTQLAALQGVKLRAGSLNPTLGVYPHIKLRMHGGTDLSVSKISITLSSEGNKVTITKKGVFVQRGDSWELFTSYGSEALYAIMHADLSVFCGYFIGGLTVLCHIANGEYRNLVRWINAETQYIIYYRGGRRIAVRQEGAPDVEFEISFDPSTNVYSAQGTSAAGGLMLLKLRNTLKGADRWTLMCLHMRSTYKHAMLDTLGHLYAMRTAKIPAELQAAFLYLKSLARAQFKGTNERWCTLHLISKDITTNEPSEVAKSLVI